MQPMIDFDPTESNTSFFLSKRVATVKTQGYLSDGGDPLRMVNSIKP